MKFIFNLAILILLVFVPNFFVNATNSNCESIKYGDYKASATCTNNKNSKAFEKTLIATCSPAVSGKGMFNELKIKDKKVLQPGWSAVLQVNCPENYIINKNSGKII